MSTPSSKFWQEHFTRLQESLVAQVERILKASGHSTIKGTSIEIVVRRLLTDYLPRYFAVRSGQVANTNGQLSPQQDIIIYDASAFPPLSVNEDSSVVICCESLYAVVECKTRWRQKDIENHVRNTISIDVGRRKEFSDKEYLPAYFVIFHTSSKRPKLQPFEKHERTIGFYCLTSDKSWIKNFDENTFNECSGRALETFFKQILKHCMRIGQIEVGDFSTAYKTLADYIGWS